MKTETKHTEEKMEHHRPHPLPHEHGREPSHMEIMDKLQRIEELIERR